MARIERIRAPLAGIVLAMAAAMPACAEELPRPELSVRAAPIAPMIEAASLGQANRIADLLSEGAAFAVVDPDGNTALSLAAHIAGDVITGFGTMVFAPLSRWRAALGTTFIIDLWFSGIILAGLIASAVAALVAKRTARAAITSRAPDLGLRCELSLMVFAQRARPPSTMVPMTGSPA